MGRIAVYCGCISADLVVVERMRDECAKSITVRIVHQTKTITMHLTALAKRELATVDIRT